MNFGEAINALKKGNLVARQGWNGKGMFLVYIESTENITPKTGTPYSYVCKKAGVETINIDGHIDMFTAGKTMQPGWLASQADILAEDWVIVD